VDRHFTHRARRKLIALLFLGLAVRVVMPAGYMPAALGEGGPFVLCPGGLTGASFFLAAGSEGEHHDHGSDESGEVNAWEFCPFNTVSGSFGPVTDLPAAVSSFDTLAPIAAPELPWRSRFTGALRARGPPLKQPLV
jgi:hypothetical protein